MSCPPLFDSLNPKIIYVVPDKRTPPGFGQDDSLANPHAASVFSTSLIQYDVPYTIASSLKL